MPSLVRHEVWVRERRLLGRSFVSSVLRLLGAERVGRAVVLRLRAPPPSSSESVLKTSRLAILPPLPFLLVLHSVSCRVCDPARPSRRWAFPSWIDGNLLGMFWG